MNAHKKVRNAAAAIVLSVGVVLSALLTSFQVRAAGAEDKTAVLTDSAVSVTQDGNPIPEGGTITSTKPIHVSVSFGVPVVGDDPPPTNPVQWKDSATFDLSDAFTTAPSGSYELNAKDGTLVGHVSFTMGDGGDSKMVVAHVLFDGDQSVFKEGTSDVTGRFEADFQYDASGSSGDAGDHTIAILQKTYTVRVPDTPIVYDVQKQGTADLADKSVTWKVTVSATRNNAPIDLKGYQFSDDLTNVGEYKDSSFQAGPDAGPLAGATPTQSGRTISYTFPEGSTSPQTVQFKTKIPDARYYTQATQNIDNTAELWKDETEVDNGPGTATFTPQWITKSGSPNDNGGGSGTYSPADRTITWTITANEYGASLPSAVITDDLTGGLTVDPAYHAQWSIWNGTAWVSQGNVPSTGDETHLVYPLGTISTPVQLTIVTKVPDDIPSDTYTTGVTRYSNSASISWGNTWGTPGFSASSPDVGIGYSAITKTGTPHPSDQTVSWSITVDPRGQAHFPDNLTVYDLLVYGKATDFNINTVSGIPDGIAGTDLTPRYGQKYVDGSFSGPDGVTATKIPITQGSRTVADLVKITGLSNAASNTFSFDSRIADPDIFAGNETTTVWNTAALFSGTLKLNASDAPVDYPSNMLKKEMLTRGTDPSDAASVNGSSITTDQTKGFDYQDRSVIFRLSVNADGLALSETKNYTLDPNGAALGKATVTDALPAGWVFEPIAAGKNYLVFAGEKNPGGTRVTATGDPLTAGVTTDDFIGTNTASFTFASLNQPYVILVRAKPTDETAAGYFKQNGSTTVKNRVTLSAENWTPGVTAAQDVKIDGHVVGKTETLPEAGVLKWAVDYNPSGLTLNATKLEDRLPAGVDLRTDSHGALLLDGNITANELTLNPDGSLALGSPVALTLGDTVSYDSVGRLLTFKIPNSAKAYRFSYLTDITGEPGANVTNNVSLYGVDSNPVETHAQYGISSADGSATLQRNGWISITKKDGSDQLLPGAEFKLFASDRTTVIRQGTTDSSGILKLKAIPDGEYILRETSAPTGLAVEGADHSVSVATNGTAVTTSVDGKTGTNSNAVTVYDLPSGTAGNLTVSKAIAGNAADPTKEFTFALHLTGAGGANVDGNYSYVGSGVPGGTIAITNGSGTFSLAGGQSVTILGLPAGAKYRVTEADYFGDGYSASSSGATGTIAADGTKSASFTNTKNSSGGGGGLPPSSSETPSSDTSSAPSAPTPGVSSAPGASQSVGSAPGGGTVSTGPAALYIKKADPDGKALSGAEFTLFGADGKALQKKVTGASGVIVFRNLPAGGYVVRETKAPAGYKLYSGQLDATLTAGQKSGYTLRDAREEDDAGVLGWTSDASLPKTGEFPIAPLAAACGLLLIVIGVVVRRPDRRKKQKKYLHG